MTLREYLDAHADRDGRPGNEVLIFDQFEEVLTADPTDEPAKHAVLRRARRDAARPGPLGAVLHARGLPRRAGSVPRVPPDAAADDVPARPALGARGARGDPPPRAARGGRLHRGGRPAAGRRPADRAGAAARAGITEVLGSYVEPVQLQVACHLLWSTLPPDATRDHPGRRRGARRGRPGAGGLLRRPGPRRPPSGRGARSGPSGTGSRSG